MKLNANGYTHITHTHSLHTIFIVFIIQSKYHHLPSTLTILYTIWWFEQLNVELENICIRENRKGGEKLNYYDMYVWVSELLEKETEPFHWIVCKKIIPNCILFNEEKKEHAISIWMCTHVYTQNEKKRRSLVNYIKRVCRQYYINVLCPVSYWNSHASYNSYTF